MIQNWGSEIKGFKHKSWVSLLTKCVPLTVKQNISRTHFLLGKIGKIIQEAIVRIKYNEQCLTQSAHYMLGSIVVQMKKSRKEEWLLKVTQLANGRIWIHSIMQNPVFFTSRQWKTRSWKIWARSWSLWNNRLKKKPWT